MSSVNSTMLQRTLVLGLSVAATAWLVVVTLSPTPSSLIAVVGLLAAFVWVFKMTYLNAQPASSLAQTLHDADARALPGRAPKVR